LLLGELRQLLIQISEEACVQLRVVKRPHRGVLGVSLTPELHQPLRGVITRLRDVEARVLAHQGRGGGGALELGEGMTEVAAESLIGVGGEVAVLLLDRTPSPVRVGPAYPSLVLP